MLDQKSVFIMKKCVEEKEIAISKLMQMMNLTKRQIFYSIEKINDFLSNASIPSIQIDGKILSLSEKTERFIIDSFINQTIYNFYIPDGREREKFIFLILLYRYNEYISVPHLLENLEVGKTTFLQDIKHLEELLSVYKIKILNNRVKGYFLSGNELDIRMFFIKNILIDFNETAGEFIYYYFLYKEKIKNFNELQNNIKNLLEKYDIKFLENRFNEFCYTFQLLLTRIEIPINIENKLHKSLDDSKEYKMSKELLLLYGITNEESTKYMCSWILSLSIGNIHEATFDKEMILDIVTRITNRFELISGIRFINKRTVIEKLYGHFRSTYYRLIFKIPIVNYYVDRINTTYTNLMKIVAEVMKPISNLIDNKIPDEEIAYLTMHFAVAIDKYEEQKINKEIGIVVCPNGIGSSAIVINELKILFPEFILLGPYDTNSVELLSKNYDYIFSTELNVRLYTLNKPVFIVNPIMTSLEKYSLLRNVLLNKNNSKLSIPKISELIHVIEKNTTINNRNILEKEVSELFVKTNNSDTISSYNNEENLSTFLKKEFIQFHIPAKDYDTAIKFTAAPLLKNNIITENYILEILKYTNRTKNWMLITDKVSLPHTKSIYGANCIGFGLGVLENEIKLDTNRKVKYVIILSTIDNTSHLKAIAQLTHFLEDKVFFNLLQNTDKPEVIYEYILKNENI